MVQLSDLLSRGYFPKELPPPFRTDQFAAALTTSGIRVPPEFSSNPKPRDSAWCNHNLVRTGGLRRHLGIPNPVHFYRFAELVEANWQALRSHAKASPYSLSKPTTGAIDRAISPEHRLSERALQRASMRTGSRFLVQADISRFFPSVYTHSLPWALFGKSVAKAHHASKMLTGKWQDTLDVMSRSLNLSQTVGLPIGPDTSWLLAEVILSTIDQEVAKVCPRARGIRFIDDYEFATQTRADAEAVLNALQIRLAEFELALNGSKTRVVELPASLETAWTNTIRCYAFRTGGAITQRHDIIGYFDTVFDLFKRYPEEGLLKYAVGRLRTVDVEPDNWELLQAVLGQCVKVEPACIPQVCDQLVHYTALGFAPTKALWKETLNQVVCEHLPLGHASEAAWAMWLLKCLGFRLTSSSVKIVGACDDSVAALMGLGLVDLGLCPRSSRALISGLSRFGKSNNELFEAHWLLVYQGTLMGHLRTAGSTSILQTDPRFRFMEAQNVSFFDIGVSHPVPNRTLSGGGGGGGY